MGQYAICTYSMRHKLGIVHAEEMLLPSWKRVFSYTSQVSACNFWSNYQQPAYFTTHTLCYVYWYNYVKFVFKSLHKMAPHPRYSDSV